jgi:hypothetical protein
VDLETIGTIILDRNPGDRALVIFLIAVPAVLLTVRIANGHLLVIR